MTSNNYLSFHVKKVKCNNRKIEKKTLNTDKNNEYR